MNKKFVSVVAAILLAGTAALFAQDAASAPAAPAPVENFAPAPVPGNGPAPAEVKAPADEKSNSSDWKYIAAGLAVGIACLAGGMAVGKIGAAAMGAMSENAELSGKALPFVGLAEGICLWGFLVALLIIIL